MSKNSEIRKMISSVISGPWEEREGQVVPKTKDVELENGAVNIDAMFLYADLAGSTELQKTYYNTFSAKVVRMYLAVASRRYSSVKDLRCFFTLNLIHNPG